MKLVDERDLAVLEELRRNARQSTADIARKTRLPRVTVHDRIRKLVERGVIKKFSAVPDYEKIGLPVTAFVLASYAPGHGISQRKVAEQIAKIDGVREVHLISGEWDLLLKVRGKSMEELGSLVIDNLRAVPGIAKTLTIACFKTVKEEI
ncbi:MAG: Lrp/AsnC family transcriptional regulator [Candidatus Micrarchaeota archaeon]